MKQPIAFAALAALTALPAQATGPADPEAPVPRLQYRSVFQDTPTGVEEGQDDWKKANAEVGQFPRGHADILKWEQARQPGAAAPARPASAPATAPAPAHPPGHRH